MADQFDPYREALIVEVETAWPEEYDDWEPTERARVERLLHQSPEQASQLRQIADRWAGGNHLDLLDRPDNLNIQPFRLYIRTVLSSFPCRKRSPNAGSSGAACKA